MLYHVYHESDSTNKECVTKQEVSELQKTALG